MEVVRSCASTGQDVRVPSGEMSLRDVLDQFAAGKWTKLINQARQIAARISRAMPKTRGAVRMRPRAVSSTGKSQGHDTS